MIENHPTTLNYRNFHRIKSIYMELIWRSTKHQTCFCGFCNFHSIYLIHSLGRKFRAHFICQ